jgi:putative tryptophan/tyrosine transport system substrate-binding protein
MTAKMKRRSFITLLGGATAWPLAARAQLNAATLRLAHVWLGDPGTDESTLAGLRKGLQDLGYVEGKNFKLSAYYANGSEQRLDALLAEIVKQRETDILLTSGTIASRAAKRATKTIPVVSVTGDPIRAGIVTSIAHPGGNITGFTISAGPEIGEKWLELICEAFPRISRIAVLWNSSSAYSVAVMEKLKDASGRLGVTALSHEVRQASDFAGAFDAITKEEAEAIVGDTDPLTLAHRTEIVDFAARAKLPGIYGLRDVVDAGGLMSYGASIFNILRNAAAYVDRIAKGANPGDLPIQQPTKFELVVNLKAARAIGVTLPTSILLRADEVIE